MLMLDCWLGDSDKRPTFSELVLSIDNYLSSVAGYMDLSRLDRLPSITEAVNEENDVYVSHI